MAKPGGVRVRHVSGHDEPDLSGRSCRTFSLGPAAEPVPALFHHLFRRAPLVFSRCFPSCVCACDLCGLPGAWRMGHEKYLCPDRRLFVHSVCLLHGLPRRTGPVETGLTLSHLVLPDGSSRGRHGRRVGGTDRPPYFSRVLGIPSRLVDVGGSSFRGACARPELMALLQSMGLAWHCRGGRHAAGDHLAGGDGMEGTWKLVSCPAGAGGGLLSGSRKF